MSPGRTFTPNEKYASLVQAVLDLLSRCGGRKAPRIGERLIEQILTALDEQTVTVPGRESLATTGR